MHEHISLTSGRFGAYIFGESEINRIFYLVPSSSVNPNKEKFYGLIMK